MRGSPEGRVLYAARSPIQVTRRKSSMTHRRAYERLERGSFREHRYFWLAAYLCYTAVTAERAIGATWLHEAWNVGGRFVTHAFGPSGTASSCAFTCPRRSLLGRSDPSDPTDAILAPIRLLVREETRDRFAHFDLYTPRHMSPRTETRIINLILFSYYVIAYWYLVYCS